MAKIVLEGFLGESQQQEVDLKVAAVPMRLGGLGFRQEVRLVHSGLLGPTHCHDPIPFAHVAQFRELQESTRVLHASGFIGRPSWRSLRAGARPLPATVAEAV